jgi:hypothetical protein
MPDKKRPDLEFNAQAANELDEQAKRADYQVVWARLQELAENLAAGDSDRPDELRDIVERKHVLLAAESLFASDPIWLTLLDPGHGVFLSYSTKDEDFARELESDLRAEGVSSFLASLSIKPGSSWPDEIWQAIRNCRAFVLLATAEAIKSKWCLLEIGAALGLKKAIIAVLRHSAKLPDVLKTVQSVKVQTKKQQAELIERLKKMCFADPRV